MAASYHSGRPSFSVSLRTYSSPSRLEGHGPGHLALAEPGDVDLAGEACERALIHLRNGLQRHLDAQDDLVLGGRADVCLSLAPPQFSTGRDVTGESRQAVAVAQSMGRRRWPLIRRAARRGPALVGRLTRPWVGSGAGERN